MNPDNTGPIRDHLSGLLSRAVSPAGWQWIGDKLEEILTSRQDRTFYLSFSAVPRYLGKAPLDLTDEGLARAGALRPGFRPRGWTADRLGRVWLLLHLPHTGPDDFAKKMELLFDTADMGELVALYSSLPLLPYGERFAARAAEGVRTNMTVVFDAIALDNPYPADYLDEGAWNQLVLKAAFLDRPLYRIIGLDRRANAALARIISDYAHERWAAGRTVSPELWRPTGPFADAAAMVNLRRLLAEDNPLHHQAAALVCAAAGYPPARALLAEFPKLEQQVAAGALTWDGLAEAWWREKK